MVRLAARLTALGRRAAQLASPSGVVVIYPTRDEHGARLSDEAIRAWQDAAARAQHLVGVRTVLLLPEKDAGR